MIYDVIIIGSGISGLSLSFYLPKETNALLLCKEEPWECNTFYAQGGVAFSKDAADIPLHIKDTIEAGCGAGNLEAIRFLCENSKAAVDDLMDAGMEFDRNAKGELAFTKEGAHSISRIVHCNGDATGRVMHSFLIEKLKHPLQKNSTVVDLLVEDGICYGVTVFDGNDFVNLYASNVVIASGGIGSLYRYNTNSHTISGDLQGLVVEKGGSLQDAEMLQFHPSVYVKNPWARKFLLSEALRGEGAHIVDSENKRFLFEYDSRGELAPRDVISRAIFEHKNKTGLEVFLSFEAFSKEFFERRFPNIYKNLLQQGYNLPEDKVPISPAFHYSMGGIKTDLSGRVEGIENLYAVGEAACNGLHGANRLASNSLLESLVFAKCCARELISTNKVKVKKTFPKSNFVLVKSQDQKFKERLRELMWNDVGIIRTREGLEEALGEISAMLKADIGRMLYLRLLCAKEIAKSALAHKESIGAHFLK